MSIVSKIQTVVDKMSIASATDFGIGERGFTNLETAVRTYQIWIDAPMQSTGSIRSNNLNRVYQVKMLFLTKQNFGNTYLEHYNGAIDVMKGYVKEFLLRINNDKDPITNENTFYPAANIRETDIINLFDENLSGILLEFDLQEVRQGSYCTPNELPAPNLYLAANKTSVNVGEQIRLTWIATNVTNIEITGIGQVSAIGSTLLTITAETTFTATATNSAGTATDSITIEIVGACDDATAVLKDTLGNVISTTNIPSGDSEDIPAPDGNIVLKKSNGDTLRTVSVRSNQTKDETIGNSTVNLVDSAGNPISTTSVPAETTVPITAPNGTLNIRNTTPTLIQTETVRSNETKNVTLGNINLTINDQFGNPLSVSSEPAAVNITKAVTTAITLNLTVSASTTTPVTNQTVNFTGGCTNGTPTQWLWSFGDGGASTLQNPTYSYRYAGTYTVILTATDGTNDGYVVFSSTITVTLQTLFSTNLQQYLACGIGASPSNMTLVSGAISQWNDESGNNYHVTQGTITSRPAYVSNLLVTSVGTFGGGAFDGANDFLQNTAAGFTRAAGSFEMFLMRKKRLSVTDVYSEATSGNFYEIYSLANNPTILLFNGSISTNALGYTINDFFILQVHWNGANSYMQINELSRYTIPNNLGTNSSVGTTIAATFTGSFSAQMDLLEKLVYSSKPSDANITTIINRWKSKFGLW